MSEKICSILSVPYSRASLADACDTVLRAAREGRCFSVFTPGATIAAAARKDKGLLSLLLEADLLLADGVGCRLAARLSGKEPPPVNAGISLAEALLARGDAEGLRVFLYGARDGVAARAAEALQKKHPHLVFAHAHGYGDDPIDAVRAFSPQLVFVSLGFPRQERWIAKHRSALSCPALGLGGSLDVWSGEVARAPSAWQKAGLEWLWRTIKEPRRVRRLLPLPAYFLACAREGAAKILHKRQKEE